MIHFTCVLVLLPRVATVTRLSANAFHDFLTLKILDRGF